MQCLYCETELKPLRGLFDEDFCCKEHREKYFASFRKGVNRLPVLDLPPLDPEKHSKVETIPVAEASVQFPEPEIELIVEEAPDVQLLVENPPPVREIAAKARESAAAVEASFEGDATEEAPTAPLAADFLHLPVVPAAVEDCYFMIEENPFSACNGPAIPDVEVFCDAAFDMEEGSAHLLAPADVAAAASGRAATFQPQPAALAPTFRAWDYAAPPVLTLEPAELIENVEMFVAGRAAEEMSRSAGSSQTVAWAPALLTVPAFQASFANFARPDVAAPVAFDIDGQHIETAPLMFFDMSPTLEIHTPAFQVSAAAMQLDEELKRALEPAPMEAARLAEPEIARPAAMSAAPVSHVMPAATFQPTMPSPARPEAKLSVPAMSSKADATPGVASEVAPDPPRGAAAEQPPPAHSSEPVPPAIQNSARIKNWRLKITFAKPA